MPRAGSTKKDSTRPLRAEEKAGRSRNAGGRRTLSDSQLLSLQQVAGNRAVGDVLRAAGGERTEVAATLLRQAAQSGGRELDPDVRQQVENELGADLSGVRVHEGRSSEAAAASIDAKAYTVGSDIYLGEEASRMSSDDREKLLTHEAVHTVQQGGRSIPLEGELKVSQPTDRSEAEASNAAQKTRANHRSDSPALALRGALRASPVAPGIQRDITGTKKLGYGEFKIDFKKKETTVKGGTSRERGTVTFTPDQFAPESDSIRFVQIVRNTDTTTGDLFDWTGSGQDDLNNMRTTRDNAKNIAPGFHIDQRPDLLKKRTKKTDPAVLPYYDAMLANPKNKIGKRKGATIDPAVLSDAPGASIPIKWNFVTSAKAADTGTWYGTVLWGFETYLDKTGFLKIKNEYHSFREFRGETTDEAMKIFDEFWQNPGTSKAPK